MHGPYGEPTCMLWWRAAQRAWVPPQAAPLDSLLTADTPLPRQLDLSTVDSTSQPGVRLMKTRHVSLGLGGAARGARRKRAGGARAGEQRAG